MLNKIVKEKYTFSKLATKSNEYVYLFIDFGLKKKHYEGQM